MAGKLVLCRHGQSEWNLENKFTGWEDVGLTPLGEEEALEAGKQLKAIDINFDIAFTSLLKRANKTLFSILEQMDLTWIPITHAWELNERHYGALQGKNKAEVAKEFGDEQVHIWRRSYDIPPPLLLDNDKRHPKFNKKFQNIKDKIPVGESLQDVIKRLNPFWEKYILNIKKKPGNHLIIAHSNSLRAIIKILEKLSNKEIISINIPTGVPLVYTIDNNLKIYNKKYLIDKEKLKEKETMVLNQGKVK